MAHNEPSRGVILLAKPQLVAGIAFKAHKEAPSGQLPPGACDNTLLTCGYCRKPQFSDGCVENLAYSATASSDTSASTSTVSTSSSAASSVTPTRTLTTAVISR